MHSLPFDFLLVLRQTHTIITITAMSTITTTTLTTATTIGTNIPIVWETNKS